MADAGCLSVDSVLELALERLSDGDAAVRLDLGDPRVVVRRDGDAVVDSSRVIVVLACFVCS